MSACPFYLKTGTQCGACDERGPGACQTLDLEAQLRAHRIERKMRQVEQREHVNFTGAELRDLLTIWREHHPRADVPASIRARKERATA